MLNRALFIAILAPALLAWENSYATADGPNCFKVINVKSNDTLNIRKEPNAKAKKVGEIPHNGNKIRNLLCASMPSELRALAIAGKSSPELKDWSVNKNWCEVQYGKTRGFVHAKFLGEGECTIDDLKPQISSQLKQEVVQGVLNMKELTPYWKPKQEGRVPVQISEFLIGKDIKVSKFGKPAKFVKDFKFGGPVLQFSEFICTETLCDLSFEYMAERVYGRVRAQIKGEKFVKITDVKIHTPK